ncbi:MAG TPA: VWA domain-containing protein, partial [Thermoanaerobaculia bacterium]
MKPRTLASLVTAAGAVIAAIAAIAAPAAVAAPPPSGAPAPGFGETASVVSVEVPVTVVRGDEPVRGLTAADFALYDDGKPQKITGFEVVDLAAPAAGAMAPTAPTAPSAPTAPAIPVAARRHFLFLFDLSFSEPAGLVRAQKAAKGLLRQSMHPSDLVAVASYSSAEGPRLLLGFSPDRRQAEYAIDTLGAPQLVDRSPDPLGLLYLTDKGETGGAKGADVGGKGADLAGGYFKEIARVEVRAERQARRDVVTSMSRSLAELAKRMAGIEGKKYVVYLSQGFDSEFLLGTTDEETVRKNQAAAASGARVEIDSDQRYGDTKLAGDVERMLEQFRRADCTIESVDIGGLQAGGDQQARHPGGKESLFTMARATGGDLVENTNDLGGGMAKLLARTSVTYLLSFQPENLVADGRYRPLKVKLSNERLARGARVVARPGYYAPLPYLARSPVERRLAAAGAVLGAPGGRIATSVLATPLPVAGQAAYVPVVIEIDGPALLAGATTTAQADVFAYALDEQGTVHDHFAQALELDLAKVRGVLARGGVKLYGHFDLAPGRYLLRVLARNGLT